MILQISDLAHFIIAIPIDRFKGRLGPEWPSGSRWAGNKIGQSGEMQIIKFKKKVVLELVEDIRNFSEGIKILT